jgi:hypothetical protein
MDFNNEEDVQRFMEMDAEEKREALDDALAEVAQEWMSDEVDDVLARSIVGAMRSYMEGAFSLGGDGDPAPNPYVMGVWHHGYRRMVTTFQALAGITTVKKSLKPKDES